MEKANGNSIEVEETNKMMKEEREADSLFGVLQGLIWSVFFPDPNSPLAGTSFFHRVKTSVREDLPRLRDASQTTGIKVLTWARRGSPFRALLVVSVGSITLLTLTGLMVFMMFFVAATLNAIVISLLVSLAAAGGFLALFFACVAAIYVGALSVAVFVIGAATISAVVATIIVAGWIGFFFAIWLAMRKCASIAKRSINVTGSAISAYSSNRHTRRDSHHHRE